MAASARRQKHLGAGDTDQAVKPGAAVTQEKRDERRLFRCPMCQAESWIDAGFTSWCDRCGLNVWPYEKAAEDGLFDRSLAALQRRFGQRLLSDALTRVGSPRTSLPTLLAMALALGVYLLTSLFLAAAGWLFLVFFMEPGMLFGLVPLALAWEIRPRFGGAPAHRLARSDAPSLFALLDSVCSELDAPRLDWIVPTFEFNATFQQSGCRGRGLLLGIPLWNVASDQERVGIVAHEVGHAANGDPTRGWLIRGPVTSLRRLHRVLWLTANTRTGWEPLSYVFLLPLYWLARLAGGLAVVLLSLTYADSQRAEYAADASATRLAGTETMTSLLRKLGLLPVWLATVRAGTAEDDPGQALKCFRQLAANLPEHERERLRRIAARDVQEPGSTHPPTGFRIRVLEAHPQPAARLELGPSQSASIAEELMTGWNKLVDVRKAAKEASLRKQLDW